MCDSRYLMKRMKNLISIVFLTVWLLNTVQALAGVCGSGNCCCTSESVSITESIKAFDGQCGQKDCVILGNNDVQKQDMTLPSVKTISQVSLKTISLEYFSIHEDVDIDSFDRTLPHLSPQFLKSDLYIRYHQFLI